MSWNKLDERIQNSDGYRFYKKYNRLIVFLQGIIVIGLLIGINLYFYQDYHIKEQIRDKCGYEDNNWQCVCTKAASDLYEAEMTGSKIIIDLDTNRVATGQTP